MSMHNWTVCRIILQISIFLSISKMCKSAICHFICTFISENQDLGRLRSVSNLTKISGPAHLNFFSVDLTFFQFVNWTFFRFVNKSEKKSGDKLKKKSGVQELKFS